MSLKRQASTDVEEASDEAEEVLGKIKKRRRPDDDNPSQASNLASSSATTCDLRCIIDNVSAHHGPEQAYPGFSEEAKREDCSEKDFSQNRNTTLWCIAGNESGSDRSIGSIDTFWDPSDFEHAVDDPLFWGPYLSERQWGTVREDFSENDNSWEHVSYEDAIGHAYVSGEDGLLGASDRCSLLCTSVALWNGKDPILKERLFGLTGIEGNHGEDVKELYYYLDNLPDHSYMRALYKYPQSAFPYQWLREENKKRTFHDREFELTDTGVFEEGGHWDVTVEYVKTDHLGLACHIEVFNCGRHEAVLHLIPQFWFRHVQKNEPVLHFGRGVDPLMKLSSTGGVRIHYSLGNWRLMYMLDGKQEDHAVLFTDNVSASAADRSEVELPIFTKDAFNRYVVKGEVEAVNPQNRGTKCGIYYALKVTAGSKASVYWRIESLHYPMQMDLKQLKNHFVQKRKEATDYYEKMMPNWKPEERSMGIQALAGLLWSKQYYLYDVKNWLEDYRRCRENKGKKGRNWEWSHVHNHHILLMPDKWEFPWYAGWDLCISAVLYARFCPKFAKQQMITFLSDCYMHPRGQLPGCEFEMGDSNPPLQPWAVLSIFHREGGTDHGFLRKCFHRLLLNYNWWCGKEYESTSLYGRGFLGMDNICVIDRSGHLPHGWSLVQADCTGWMACYTLWMMQIAVVLGHSDLVYCDLITRFLSHFLRIATAMNRSIHQQGLWHDDDRFLYDVFYTRDGPLPIQLRSMSGLVPLLACAKISLRKCSTAAIPFDSYINEYPQFICRLNDKEVFLSALCLPRVESIVDRVFSEEEFLGPFGIRSLSKVYEKEPFSMQVDQQHLTVRYAPGESDSGTFGGNSNWRGPVWVFMNYLLMESLDLYQSRVARCSSLCVGVGPSHSRKSLTPSSAAMTDLAKRLVAIFLPDKEGRRPVHGSVTRYTEDPRWRHLVLFYEFIHADTGRGCGASHQTGWTAAILEILYRLHGQS